MMLGPDISATLPELRAHAESMMRDTVLVERETGVLSEPDPVTLEQEPVWATVYQGKGRIQRPGTQPSDTVVGEVEFGFSTVLAQLPLSAVGILRDHRVTVTAIDALTDPDLLGVVATVKANLTKSHPTKRTLVCEEVTVDG